MGGNLPGNEAPIYGRASVLRVGARRAAAGMPACSAGVVLDGSDVALLRAVRVAPELALGPALAQQVPALVEFLFHVLQARRLLGRRGRPGTKLVLLLDQGVDVVLDALVAHRGLPQFPSILSGTAAEFHHAIGRQAEVVRSAAGVAVQPGEHRLARTRHGSERAG